MCIENQVERFMIRTLQLICLSSHLGSLKKLYPAKPKDTYQVKEK